jgi:AGCS family alanine or glycine:cation symporter
LGIAFAIFGSLAGFGIANTVQSNSVSQVLHDSFSVPPIATGLVLMILVGAVVLGGIKRIASVASWLVPIMALSYILMSLVVILVNMEAVPGALVTIVSSAFTPTAATGGFAGATVWAALRFGVARGIFSNEAGLGSAPIAHAAARTDQPVQQGMIAMLGTFIDTLIVCTMTGLVIVIMDVWPSGVSGASLTTMAFANAFPGGEYIVTLGLCLFAFTTMIGWSFYGERCVVFLFGTRAILPFRVAWVLAIPVGTVVELNMVWLIADTLNAFMAIPNLIALILLGPLVFRITREYFENIFIGH